MPSVRALLTPPVPSNKSCLKTSANWTEWKQRSLKELVDTLMIDTTLEMQLFTELDIEPRPAVSSLQRGDSGNHQDHSQFT